MATVPVSVSPSLAGWQWPADVLEFARNNQLEAHLDPLLAASRQVYPTARSIRVFLSEDPGIPEDKYITFEVCVPSGDVASYVDAVHAWSKERRRLCPMPLVYLVRLLLIPVEAAAMPTVLTQITDAMRTYERDVLKEITWQS